MNEFSQSHSKQPYYLELNATKSQSIKGYRPLHPELPIQKLIEQYGYNTQLDTTRRDLETTR